MIKNFMMANFTEILTYSFLENSLSEYLIAFGVFLLVIIALKIFKRIIIAKIKQIVDHTETDLDDLIIKILDFISWPFYVFLALYLAFQLIQLPDIVEKSVAYFIFILIAYYIVKGIQEFIDYGFGKIIQKRKEKDERFEPSTLRLLGKAAKGMLWVGAVIIVLQNLGYNISALVAGLGIGGVAIAFALQGILSDIFASFSIYFDKPFQAGDFIIIGDDLGTVKKIGIKSTRIQTLQGEELVVSNKELTEVRVHNYKRMEKRRIVFTFGVVYKTPTEKLKKISSIVKNVINKVDLADIDRVHFKEFGDFSLNFEVVYYLNTSDYNKYMDTQQEINLALKEELEKEGIEFAYPTQTIFLNKT